MEKPTAQNFRKLGKVKDAHGLKGELYIYIPSGEAEWLEELTICGLSSSFSEMQFFEVESVKWFKEGLRLKLKGVDDRNASEKLKGSEFFISEDLLVSDKGETIYLDEILDFKVYDGENLIGQIVDFSSNGAQDLLVVECLPSKKIVEIPYVEPFVEKIDWDLQELRMNLPEGLVDLESLT